MPEETAPEQVVETTESAPSSATTFEEAIEQAEAAQEGTGAESAATEPKASPTVEQAEEPEHVRWAKSVNGNVDPATGQIVHDRVLKQAFELNKQAQHQAQVLSQLEAVFKHPRIASVLAEISGAAAPKLPDQPEAEKTDEQRLEEYVNERIQKAIGPIQAINQPLVAKYVDSEMNNTYNRLKEEFGTDDSGVPLYDTVRDQVVASLAQAAANAGLTPHDLATRLALSGKLYESFATATRNLLFPKVAEAARKAKTSGASLEAAKRAQLVPKGTPAREVKPAGRKVDSFEDAVEAAEEELAKAN